MKKLSITLLTIYALLLLFSMGIGCCAPVALADDAATAHKPTTEAVELPLTLEALLAQIQQNHPKLRGADLQRKMASAKRLEKQGAFDPALSLGNQSQRYNSSSDKGQDAFQFLNGASVGVVTRYGAKLSAGSELNYGKVKSPGSSTGQAGTHGLSLNVPLLRGARINEKAAAERQAILGEPLADAEFSQYRLGFLLKASGVYWEWVSAKLKVDANQALFHLAQQRAQQIRSRAKAGDLALIDSVEAEQEAQRRQEVFFKAQRDFQKACFALANYLWDEEMEQIHVPSAQRVPETFEAPQALNPDEVDRAKLVALQNRPELAQLNLLQKITDVDLDLARNQLLPILDLYANPGLDLGADSVGPVFKAGVSVSVPLRNRTARGQIEQARLKLQKLDLEQKALLQQILLEVEDTASELNMAYARYQAAGQAYQLAQQLAAGEQTRFAWGDSTLFLVNQRERATTEALIKQIELQAEYQQARVRLLAVTGQL